MLFESRVFAIAKDTEHSEQYEDSYSLNADADIAAVADGVSSAIFSRQWAGILTQAAVADPIDPTDEEAFSEWLARYRQAWTEQIDATGLAWFQKAKMALGAFSTLAWVRLSVPEHEEEGEFGALRLQGYAIGDSCLFHIRDGELVRSFPIQHSSELSANPVVLGSLDLDRDHLMQFETLDEACYSGDLLVLCTDAIADWVLRMYEAETPPDWDRYAEISDEQWAGEILELREQGQMRYDDSTMMLLRVTEPAKEKPVEAIEHGADISAEELPAEEEPSEAVYDLADEVPAKADAVDEIPKIVAKDKPKDADKDKDHDTELTDFLKSMSKQVTERVDEASDKVIDGLRKLKDLAVEKYNEKFGPKDK